MAKVAKRNPELKGDRCDKCNGSGTVIADLGIFHAEVDCDKCHGTGLINSPNACEKCGGSGNVIVDMGGINIEATCDSCNGSGLQPES